MVRSNLKKTFRQGSIYVESDSRISSFECPKGMYHFIEGEDVSGRFKIEETIIGYDALGPIKKKIAVPKIDVI